MNKHTDKFDSNLNYYFTKYEVERVDDMFTKKDLRTGDFIVYKNNEIAQCLDTPNGIVFVSEDGFMPGEDYDNNLEYGCVFSDVYSIKEVYRPTDDYMYVLGKFEINKSKCDKVFGQSKAIPEYTMSQLQEKLGEEFKLVKE